MFQTKEEFLYLIGTFVVAILVILLFFIVALIINVKSRIQRKVALLNSIIQTQENERNRIAEDLHDDIGPILSAIKLQLNALPDSVNLKADIRESSGLLDEAIADVRYISKNLSSSRIIKLGLIKSVEEFRSMIEKSKNVTFQFNHNAHSLEISELSASTIYRIIQEMITNSLRHSACTEINLNIQFDQSRLEIIYSDNGKLNVSTKSISGSGLTNIQNRVGLLKGRFIQRPDFKSIATYHLLFNTIHLQ